MNEHDATTIIQHEVEKVPKYKNFIPNINKFHVYTMKFLRKSCHLWDNVEKYCWAIRARDDYNTAHALCMLEI